MKHQITKPITVTPEVSTALQLVFSTVRASETLERMTALFGEKAAVENVRTAIAFIATLKS